ncbi:hypothetical protein [Deefgea sp. CFH1-16]|uniref:hypothetical protein n=1 Tax=Deefgea sp. CFH1-16 TaxID=2675457 RepID=UPI0015F4EBB4|nr:hypothetical protein [Deefgea sp. CFH1-16]MBM5575303.1 hypothetical protein [Deefgea sp. CFH1-16]
MFKSFRSFKLILRAMLVLLLSACANLQLPVVNGQLTPAAEQGLAIIGLTAQSFNNDTASANLTLQGPSGNINLYTRLVTDFIRAPGDTPNATGRLFVVPLLPGQYRVVAADGQWRRDSMNLMNMYQYVTVPLNLPFQVKAGEVVYLGDVHLNMNYDSSVNLSNDHARDFFDLQARHGVSNFNNIAIQPLNRGLSQ